MNDVVVGVGELDGRGVYADRDFVAGDVVISYRLQPLTRAEFTALPLPERQFVHSYGGQRYRYPAPARYVNHSDRPNCWVDFDRLCNVAARPIRTGEAITIDAMTETDRELTTFQDAYVAAINARDTEALINLIDDDAAFWLTYGSLQTKREIVNAISANRLRTYGDRYSVSGVRWSVTTHRWEALCSYSFRSSDEPTGIYGHGTDFLRVVDGNWQLAYSHVSSGPT